MGDIDDNSVISTPNETLRNPKDGPAVVSKAVLQQYRDEIDNRKRTSSGVVVQQQKSRHIPDPNIDQLVGKFAALVSIFLAC